MLFTSLFDCLRSKCLFYTHTPGGFTVGKELWVGADLMRITSIRPMNRVLYKVHGVRAD